MSRNVHQASGSSGISAPTTRAELDALAARRGELQSQLRNLEQRRGQLSQQTLLTPPDGRAALNQRLATIDERIGQIEGQLLQLDDAIAAGLANSNLTHSPSQPYADVAPAPPPFPGWPSPPTAEGIVLLPGHGPAIPINPRTLVAGGLVTLSLLALVGWIAWRRAVATITRTLRASSGPSDLSQLQQSVDAIAVEVERISENQRFVTKLLNQQTPGLAFGGSDAAELQRVPAAQTQRHDK